MAGCLQKWVGLLDLAQQLERYRRAKDEMESSYLDKLLEIWDLDIESCSHLLQDPKLSQAKPSSTLCTSSQALTQSNDDSVDTRTQERSCIADCGFDKPLHTFSQLDLEDDAESSHIRSNQCPSCFNDNDKDANWCIHCGTALVGNHHFDMNTAQNLHQTPIDIPRVLQDATSCDISASPDELQCTKFSSTSGILKPNDISRPTTIYESNQLSKFQSSLQQTPTRRWDTSGSYTWRNPSSLDKRKSKFKHQSDIPTYTATSIPRLNLSNITQISADDCSSTRRKLSANIKAST